MCWPCVALNYVVVTISFFLKNNSCPENILECDVIIEHIKFCQAERIHFTPIINHAKRKIHYPLKHYHPGEGDLPQKRWDSQLLLEYLILKRCNNNIPLMGYRTSVHEKC